MVVERFMKKRRVDKVSASGYDSNREKRGAGKYNLEGKSVSLGLSIGDYLE